MDFQDFAYRALVAIAIAIGAAVLVLLIWACAGVLLLIFGGVLLSVLLSSLARAVARWVPISYGWSLTAVLVLIILTGGLGVWLLGPDFAAQLSQLSESLPRSLQQLADRIGQHEWGRQILGKHFQIKSLLPDADQLIEPATGLFSHTLGFLVDLFVIVSIGIYLAASPQPYVNGLMCLFPPRHRGRVRETLHEAAETLRWWLAGRAVVMAFVGVLTWLGLSMLDVPLSLTLGLMAGLLTFVPYVGPIASVVPVALIAAGDGTTHTAGVVLFYLGILVVEGYVLTPLIQQRAVSLPPALIIVMQVILGTLLGARGLVLATPLTAAGIVLVRRLYIEDALEEEDQRRTEHEARRPRRHGRTMDSSA